jgi:Flp pilus assembly protein TadG
MRIPKRSSIRDGVAAVEFAVTAPLLFLLLLGTWELGRVVQVYQILNSAVREGARIAAQGQIINLTGSYTQINVNSGTPNVYDTVENTLKVAGIDTSAFDSSKVSFTFLDSAGNPVSNPTQPWQGTKGQRFKVTATLPYSSFRWTNLNLLNITQIQVTFFWACLIDDPFTVDTNLPSWTAY